MMVNAAYIDYPSAAPEAAAIARAAMPCILKRSKSNLATDREIASPMLVEAMQKAQGTLDAETAQMAKQIVLSDLRDPDALAVCKWANRQEFCVATNCQSGYSTFEQ